MKYVDSIFRKDREYVSFVRCLNTKTLSVDQLKSRITEKAKGMDQTSLDLFHGVVFDWLWVEPDALAERRKQGELDEFIRSLPELLEKK